MAKELILTHGLVASGKSTWAQKQKDADPENVVLVERDEIRTARFGSKYHDKAPDQKSESEVSRIHQQLIKDGLRDGKKVIVSDTNLNPRFVGPLVKLARDYGAELKQEYFDVTVEECKRRNRARGAGGGRLVPEHVIDSMASRAYDADGRLKEFVIGSRGDCFAVSRNTPGMKLVKEFNERAEQQHPFRGSAVVIVDVDGTAANNNHHAAYAFGREGEKKDFPYFYRSIVSAPVNKSVRDLANRMRDEDDLNIVILTGRDDSHAKELIQFLDRSKIKISRLIVKREGDFRPDSDFKKEVVGRLKEEGLVIVHSIDDRPRSIAVWEAENVLVSRVPFSEHKYNGDRDTPFPEAAVNTIYGSGYCIRCGSPLKSGGNIGPKCRTKL